MSDTLGVHVNREELHGLEVPNTYETTGSFAIELTNHGEALHVHLHLDDALSQVASLEATNHYVEAESTRYIDVNVDASGSVRGKLKVVTAYGATTRYVDVVVSEPNPEEERVRVDESLNKPKPTPQSRGRQRANRTTGGILSDRPEIGVLALGGVALAVAVFAALILQNTLVVLGSLTVVAGVLVAVAILLQ